MSKPERIVTQLLIVVGCLALTSPFASSQGKNQPNDARNAVQTFFTLLKSQQYASLHDFLPSQLQQQITVEQLTQNLKRLNSFIAVERMEIGRVQQKGDTAVIDTTIYGRLKKPLKMNGEEVTEGRVAVQQYLLKENNHWKIATTDNRTRDFFLSRHPEFNKQFQFIPPKFEFKQNGQWTPFIRGERMREKG